MKTFVVIFFVVLAVSIEISDAGHRKKSKSSRNEESPDGGIDGPPQAPGQPGSQDPEGSQDWPHPGSVNNFDVPDFFQSGGGPGLGDNSHIEDSSGKHHGKNSHKHRKN